MYSISYPRILHGRDIWTLTYKAFRLLINGYLMPWCWFAVDRVAVYGRYSFGLRFTAWHFLPLCWQMQQLFHSSRSGWLYTVLGSFTGTTGYCIVIQQVVDELLMKLHTWGPHNLVKLRSSSSEDSKGVLKDTRLIFKYWPSPRIIH